MRIVSSDGASKPRQGPNYRRALRIVQSASCLPTVLMDPLLRLDERVGPPLLAGAEPERPVYVCGLPRSGTTITTVALSAHPHIGTHQVRDLALPFLPNGARRVASLIMRLRGRTEAYQVERIHQDGMNLRMDSAHAIEEMFWMRFFPNLHDGRTSEILDATSRNPRFEAYYRRHLRTLLACRGARRYLAKNNSNVSRMAYLLKLFPGARFVLMVRHPFSHIGSLIKQDRLFHGCPREMVDIARLTGHFDFGPGQVCLHLGDQQAVDQVLRDLRDGQAVRAWARTWAMTYSFVARQLAADPAVAQAALLLKYEDLCTGPEAATDQILAHTGLAADAFTAPRAALAQQIRPPAYYTIEFTEAEQAVIRQETGDVAAALGYRFA